MMTRRIGLRAVAIGLMLCLLASLASLGTAWAVEPPATVSVSPTEQCANMGETFTVDIVVAVNVAEDVGAVGAGLSFDPSILQATGVAWGPLLGTLGVDWLPMAGTIDNTAGAVSGYGGARFVGGVPGPGVFLTITFEVVGGGCSPLNLIPDDIEVRNGLGMELLPVALENGSACSPCCLTTTLDTNPDDEIALGEDVVIVGSGFAPDTQYDVWIVPYTENTVVAEDDSLAGLGGPGNVGTVTSDGNGDISATVWQVPQNPALVCNLYEIVVDDGDGVYHACDDGLDAVGLAEWGFHIYPEALTITLFSIGMVGLGGYYVVRRRRAL